MAEFIFNEGTGRHRGVWHLVHGALEKTAIPENIRETVRDIRDWHLDNCASVAHYYGYFPRPDPAICDCGHTGEVIGHYTTRMMTPEHVVAKGAVACPAFNQASYEKGVPAKKHKLSTGGVGYTPYGRYGASHYDGEIEVVQQGIIKPMIWEGDDFPPGPQCSRCKKILEQNWA